MGYYLRKGEQAEEERHGRAEGHVRAVACQDGDLPQREIHGLVIEQLLNAM